MLEEFKQDYPEFPFKGELFSEEGGSVVDAFYGKQFGRRKKG
jgi:hypothetical protein